MSVNQNLEQFSKSAEEASNFLKSLANPMRLKILCLIVLEQRSVGDIAQAIACSQSATSQHLALMRREGLVAPKRDGQTVYYRLADKRASKVLRVLSEMFCE
jgi:ArsR family transcriptional regulator, virulence genes transcriptional regulator